MAVALVAPVESAAPASTTWDPQKPREAPAEAVNRAQVRTAALGPHGFSVPNFVNAYGVELQTYFWPAATDDVKGVIYLLHGNGWYLPFEWLRTKEPGVHVYEGSWVERLNKADFAVVGLDFMGFGLSDGLHGLRAFFNSFDDCVADVVQLVRHVDENKVPGFTDLPRFLFGISMGGCVTVHTMHKHPTLFQAAVLLSPMLSLEKISKAGLNAYLKPVANFISYWYPSLPVAASSPNLMFPDIQRMWEADPFVYNEPTRARLATEYLAATEWVASEVKKMKFPFLVFHSEADTMCDIDGSQMLYDMTASADKEMVRLTDMWHCLVKEKGNEHVLERILAWLHPRTVGNGDKIPARYEMSEMSSQSSLDVEL